MIEPDSISVKSDRIGGIYYPGRGTGPTLVLFNQWRSGATSILSKYLAGLILKEKEYSGVLFIDRLASGGMSDNKLSGQEKQLMPKEGEQQFADEYAHAIADILKQHSLVQRVVVGGSSAGAPAALSTAIGLAGIGWPLLRVVLVEPSGLRRHGIKGKLAVPHALAKHAAAYRHRIGRGWWTPMDKEQYFAKGKMFEYRARYFAGDNVYGLLVKAISDPDFPEITTVLSKTSHVHTEAVRANLKQAVTKPHEIIEVTGNHDHICQPPSLSRFYVQALTGSKLR